jgi:hypothetical protein
MLPPSPLAAAFWHVEAATGRSPCSAAKLLAPALVAAVDGGQAGEAASALCLLLAARGQPLLLWLLVVLTTSSQRPDAAAELAWRSAQQGGTGALSCHFDFYTCTQYQCLLAARAA